MLQRDGIDGAGDHQSIYDFPPLTHDVNEAAEAPEPSFLVNLSEELDVPQLVEGATPPPRRVVKARRRLSQNAGTVATLEDNCLAVPSFVAGRKQSVQFWSQSVGKYTVESDAGPIVNFGEHRVAVAIEPGSTIRNVLEGNALTILVTSSVGTPPKRITVTMESEARARMLTVGHPLNGRLSIGGIS